MKVLLDTHAFLWWVTDDPQLSSRARRILGDSSNEAYFSAVSGWEIAIKTRLGRLSVAGDNLEDFVAEQVAANGFQVLPIHLNHVLRTYGEPEHVIVERGGLRVAEFYALVRLESTPLASEPMLLPIAA